MYKEKLIKLIKLAQGERTQNEYAFHCGLDSATLTKIIKGTRIPKPDTLKKMASRAYNNVTYEMLMEAAGYIDSTIENYRNNADNELIDYKAQQVKIDSLGDKLRKARTDAGYSQKGFAEKIGLTRDLYNKYEMDKSRPSFETINLICSTLNISSDYLLRDVFDNSEYEHLNNDSLINVKSDTASGIVNMKLVDNIFMLAKEINLSEQDLCKILNIHKSKINDWKKGKSEPTAQQVSMMANYFRVPVDYIVGLTDDRSLSNIVPLEYRVVPKGQVVFTANPHDGEQETRTMSIEEWDEAMAIAETIRKRRKPQNP